MYISQSITQCAKYYLIHTSSNSAYSFHVYIKNDTHKSDTNNDDDTSMIHKFILINLFKKEKDFTQSISHYYKYSLSDKSIFASSCNLNLNKKKKNK